MSRRFLDGIWLVLLLTGPSVSARPSASVRLAYILYHPGDVQSMAFSPDGRFLVSGSRTPSNHWSKDRWTLNLWNVRTGRLLHRVRISRHDWIQVAFSPTGRLVAELGAVDAHDRFLVRIWSVHAGRLRLVHTLRHRYLDRSGGLAFSPDGKTLAVGGRSPDVHPADPEMSDHNAVFLFDTRNWRLTGVLHGEYDGVLKEVAFTPDGRLVSARYLAETGEWLRAWNAKTREPANGMFDTDADSEMIVGPRGILFLWPWKAIAWTATGRHAYEFPRKRQHLGASQDTAEADMWDYMGLLPDGRHVLKMTPSIYGENYDKVPQSGDLELWSLAAGRRVSVWRGMRHVFVDPYEHTWALSPNGRYLATPAPGDTVRVWLLPRLTAK